MCVCARALSRSQFLTDFDEIWHRCLEPEKKDLFRWGENPIRVSPIFIPFNANSSKMAKDMNFKFGMHAPRQSPGMTPEKILENGTWSVSRDP